MCEHKNKFQELVSKGSRGIRVSRTTCSDCGRILRRDSKGIEPIVESALALGNTEAGREFLTKAIEDIILSGKP